MLHPREMLKPVGPGKQRRDTKFEAEKAETKIRKDVYDGKYGKPSGEKDFVTFVEEVYKPWAKENKRSFNTNDKYKLPMICESECFKGKTFAQISPILIEKYKKERREQEMENKRTRKPSTINRELGLISKIFSLAIKYGVTHSNPCSQVKWLPENNILVLLGLAVWLYPNPKLPTLPGGVLMKAFLGICILIVVGLQILVAFLIRGRLRKRVAQLETQLDSITVICVP